MNKNDILKDFQLLKNNKLTAVEYYDKSANAEDSYIELEFTNNYKLVIQTFWRLLNKDSILAMDTERYLLPDFNAPEKDYKNLPLNDSLLYYNLVTFKKNYLHLGVKEVLINEVYDLSIFLENDVQIQALIHCKCNSYTYYKLQLDNKDIAEISFEWK